MRKKFRKKRCFKLFRLKYILLFILFYFAYSITYHNLAKQHLNINDEMIFKLLLSEGNHHLIYKHQLNEITSKIMAFLYKIDLNKPATILGLNLVDKEVLAVNSYVDEEHHDDYNPDLLEKITDYIKDPNPTIVINPKVYIYNSHQLENYHNQYLEIYNIKPNVMMASFMLKEKLNSLGIPSIVEEANLTEFMRINNWVHADSYKASRFFILDAKNKYDSLIFFIDLHRDSIRKAQSTVTINGKSYAKTLLLVGLDNPNYLSNLKVAEEINNIIKQLYPNLSRGILKKQGKGVDGVYNQDIASQMILLEVGGVDNNIEEVLNTIDAFAKVIYQYLGTLP